MPAIENSTIRVLTALSFIAGVGVFVWNASAFTTSVENSISEMKTAITRLDKKIVGKSPEGFHRRDAYEHCLAMQGKNKDWSCPSPYKLPGYYRFKRNDNDTER